MTEGYLHMTVYWIQSSGKGTAREHLPWEFWLSAWHPGNFLWWKHWNSLKDLSYHTSWFSHHSCYRIMVFVIFFSSLLWCLKIHQSIGWVYYRYWVPVIWLCEANCFSEGFWSYHQESYHQDEMIKIIHVKKHWVTARQRVMKSYIVNGRQVLW